MESEVEGSVALGEDDGWKKGTAAVLAVTRIRKGFAAGEKARGAKKGCAEKSPPTGINGRMAIQGRL
jgi:hypothetical protein